MFSSGRPGLSAVEDHEVGEKWLGVFVGAPRQRVRDCVVAPSLEQVSVQLARLHEGAHR